MLSTCNSLLVAISTNVVHDLFWELLLPDISNEQCRKLNVAVDGAVCVVGTVIACSMSEIIKLLSLGCNFCVAGCMAVCG